MTYSISVDIHFLIIAEQHPSSEAVANLNGSEPFFTSDEYLKPSLEDDPLLRECTAGPRRRVV